MKTSYSGLLQQDKNVTILTCNITIYDETYKMFIMYKRKSDSGRTRKIIYGKTKNMFQELSRYKDISKPLKNFLKENDILLNEIRINGL